MSLYAVSIKQQESSQTVRSIFYSCLFFVVSCACVARRWAVEGSRKCMNHEGMCLCWIEPILTSQRENTHYGPVLSPSLHLQSIFFFKRETTLNNLLFSKRPVVKTLKWLNYVVSKTCYSKWNLSFLLSNSLIWISKSLYSTVCPSFSLLVYWWLYQAWLYHWFWPSVLVIKAVCIHLVSPLITNCWQYGHIIF